MKQLLLNCKSLKHVSIDGEMTNESAERLVSADQLKSIEVLQCQSAEVESMLEQCSAVGSKKFQHFHNSTINAQRFTSVHVEGEHAPTGIVSLWLLFNNLSEINFQYILADGFFCNYWTLPIN